MATRNVAKVEESATTRKRRVVASAEAPVNYFASGDQKNLDFVSSGCAILDNVLGGGYVLGRVANIVGDKSSGKTLLAIECSANFARDYPDGVIRYAEAEAAFDESYAEALGMPVDRIQFASDIFTIEDFYEDLVKSIDDLKGKPGLYILDSLDALSDRAELSRKIDEGTFGVAKPKMLGQLFRRLIQKLETSRILVIIISQIRDNIGVTFGNKTTRSGGRALDFYASQIVWLNEVEKMKREINKVNRVIGIRVRAQCKKNKVGLPWRECEFPILFGYGVDDLTANVEWLIDVKRTEGLKDMGLSEAGYKVRINNLRNKGGDEVRTLRAALKAEVIKEWRTIETAFLPQSRKY